MFSQASRGPLPSPLYAILDTGQSQRRSLDSVVEALIKGGALVVQLRAKDLAAKEYLEIARKVRALTRPAGCLFIVNDRVDIALAADADGVHLGQEDLPLNVARKLVGKDKIIGISTHDLEQANEAERGGADYIGFGPVFGTVTKDTGYAPRGIDMLRGICQAATIPVVAIGGISEANVQQVWQAGAQGAAMISDLMQADDVAEKVRRILALHKKASDNRQ